MRGLQITDNPVAGREDVATLKRLKLTMCLDLEIRGYRRQGGDDGYSDQKNGQSFADVLRSHKPAGLAKRTQKPHKRPTLDLHGVV